MLTKLGRFIEKKPWIVVAVVILITIGFAMFLPSLEFKTDFSDFMPSLAELAGAGLQKSVVIDGLSFAPQLKGQKGNPREWVYNEFEGKAWIRTKRWKLYRDGNLYDLNTDRAEEKPVTSVADSDITKKVRKKLRILLNNLK